MPWCCAINCKNSSKSIRLFRLPTGIKNVERRDVWLKNIARKNWNPEVAYICEVHFTPDQFEQNRADGRKLLKWNAIPTIFASNGKTKVKSRFIKNVKIPDDSHNVSGKNLPIVKQNVFNKDASVLILPQNVTEPINNSNGESTNAKKEQIVYIKFEPKKQEDLSQNLNIEADSILQEDIKYLKRKICATNVKIKNLENIKSFFYENLQLIFNPDQMQHIEEKCKEEINWSNETIEKAVHLFKACGLEGYKALIEQNLPYPELDLLYKFHPELNSQES